MTGDLEAATASASAVAESEVMKLRGMVTFADTKGEMRPEGYSASTV